jgi:hypothetical protein
MLNLQVFYSLSNRMRSVSIVLGEHFASAQHGDREEVALQTRTQECTCIGVLVEEIRFKLGYRSRRDRSVSRRTHDFI